MVAEILNEAVSDALTVKRLVLAGEKLRAFVSSDQPEHVAVRANPVLADIIGGLPDVSAWRMLDHCASLTRLYAVFERFIGKTVRAWLGDMPHVCGEYISLGESFKTVHRRGIARVLMDLDKDRFSYLGIETVVDGFLKAVNGNPVYTVLPEAFLSDTRSLKRDRIEELLSQVRLEGGWDWISKNRFVVAFIEDTRGGQNTSEAELRGFVNYRNEAAHGSVDQVLGVIPLSEYADFIVAVCKAIDELVRWNWVRYCKENGRVKSIGKVTERFKDNIVVAKMQGCALVKNMELLLWGQHYCYSAIIESIQLNDISHEKLDVGDETEVGLKLNCPSQKHPELLQVH
jgi:hypothetical protein